MHNVILASSSPYRADLLKRILLEFQQLSADIEESPKPKESPLALSRRLAFEKAIAVNEMLTEKQTSIIIGSDQVCYLPSSNGVNPELLSKPGCFERAVSTLMHCSGKQVTYTTSVCVLHAGKDEMVEFSTDYSLQFRHFSQEEAARYCELDEPYDCAGAIKSESHGVMLIHSHHGTDPSALVGLPLIELRRVLTTFGVQCLL